LEAFTAAISGALEAGEEVQIPGFGKFGRDYLRRERVEFASPHDARERGIETVYQDLAVAPQLDAVANNKESSSKQITTGFTMVTRENLNEPKVQKYLYKAEC
jgi:ABC-type sugar transport system ATPase subunit